jgi:drug/metabolite transporter (DMT)-like permease
LTDSSENFTRRWTVIASGLLLSALAVVVLYTGRSAFRSPVNMVVIAAIGLAAALFQVRLQRGAADPVRGPVWLNAFGVLCALLAVFADKLHFTEAVTQLVSLLAVGCFAVSGLVILVTLRRRRS